MFLHSFLLGWVVVVGVGVMSLMTQIGVVLVVSSVGEGPHIFVDAMSVLIIRPFWKITSLKLPLIIKISIFSRNCIYLMRLVC